MSMIVVAAHVSVSPYPWSTGAHKRALMLLCVSEASGAPPDKINRIRPPSNARIGLNKILQTRRNR